MKRFLQIFTLIVIFGVGIFAQESPTKISGKHKAKDEAAIETIVSNAMDNGWAKRYAPAAVSEYADDAYFINAFGIERFGKPAIEKFITAIFVKPSFAAAKVLPIKIVSITFIKPDIASVHTLGGNEGQLTDSGKAMTPRKTHIFRIMTKRGGKWLTSSFQVMDEKERVP